MSVERSPLTRRSPPPAGRMRSYGAVEIDHHFVEVAPTPPLGFIVGLHDRVPGSLEMLGRMLANRLVAAPNVTANPTYSEMDPVLTNLQAFLAAIGGRSDLCNQVQVRAPHGQ